MPHTPHLSQEMGDCIQNCQACHSVCTKLFSGRKPADMRGQRRSRRDGRSVRRIDELGVALSAIRRGKRTVHIGDPG